MKVDGLVNESTFSGHEIPIMYSNETFSLEEARRRAAISTLSSPFFIA
jgi:hypothetical protein